MELPVTTLLEIQRCVKGAMLGEQEARPILPPVYNLGLFFPGQLMPFDNVPTLVKRLTNFAQNQENVPASTAAHTLPCVTLGRGLWKVKIHCFMVSSFLGQASGGVAGYPHIEFNVKGSTQNLYAFEGTNTTGKSIDVELDLCLDDNGTTIGLYIPATGVGQTIGASITAYSMKIIAE